MYNRADTTESCRVLGTEHGAFSVTRVYCYKIPDSKLLVYVYSSMWINATYQSSEIVETPFQDDLYPSELPLICNIQSRRTDPKKRRIAKTV